jgi:purine-binding chemotaxis protein CheW
VTQVRGRWTPVIDLSLKFGLTPITITKRSCILVLELQIPGGSVPMGLVLDGVATLLELDAACLSPPPHFGAGVHVKYIQALVATERGSLPLIDLTHVFAESELEHIVAETSQANNDASLTT